MTCRDEVLVTAHELSHRSSTGEFALANIVKFMEKRGTRYKESTIRTEVVSRMCANSPDHHVVTYSDLERTDRATYRLKRRWVDSLKGGSLVENAGISRHSAKPTKKNLDLEALSEDEIKAVLEDWLGKNGWETKIAWGRTPGIDIEAVMPGKRWVIEVKGPGSRPQMRVNYFLAILGETLQRLSDADARYSIALPDLPQYRRLWERLPDLAKSKTGISILFISQNRKVDFLG